MDPNATVDLIVAALRNGEWEEAHQSLSDLRDWLRLGGFTLDKRHQEDLLAELQLHLSTKHKW